MFKSAQAQAQYLQEQKIGIDPLFKNGPRKDRQEASYEWRKLENEYKKSRIIEED